MPSTLGPNLGINHSWADGESGWKPGMDSNLKKLDTIVQLQVLDKDLATPPGSPTNGDRYIVAASPTGAWVGHATEIAVWDASAWAFYPPKDGWRVWVTDENKLYVWNAAAWQVYSPGIASGTTRKLWLPASAFGFNAIGRSSPVDEGHFEFINLPAAGDTGLMTWFKIPEDFGSLTNWKVYYSPNGTSTTTLTVNWGYILAAADGSLADNLPTLQSVSLSPGGGSVPRMNIDTLTTPSGPPTLTAGEIAKLYFRRNNAEDANPDDQRFIGILLTYTTP